MGRQSARARSDERRIGVESTYDTCRARSSQGRHCRAGYIIHEQQTCQGALAQHAVGLTGDLATAFSDIQTLFTRVDVKNMLEDKNAVLLNDMCEDTVTQISTMDRTLQAAVAAQMDLLRQRTERVQNLSSMQQKMMDDSRESLVEAKSKMDDMLTGLHEALRSHGRI
eukprot:jgi/Picre1/31015/NNA_006373.t1